jgi:beta-xylosidase
MRYFTAFLPVFFVSYVLGQSLVLPGDFPDPSVVKIGDSYWATATTSNWAPAYPLLQSKDLLHWELRSHVFTTLPAWADYYFWAPEISYDNGKVYVYYSAHKRDGNLCLGVASADKPEGPYKDHGALMCQEAGSIDAWPMRDENGKLYLIWKEDGNSVKLPTPIWAMEMNEERTKLLGDKVELFRNDAAWESNLVEGVSMIRHEGYYYAFYAGAGCCGRGCSYGIGVARSKDLLGPWEKYKKNPVVVADAEWKCPGHGTPISKDGKYYFLYHAYHSQTSVYAGRQGLLSEFKFTGDGWIEFMTTPLPVSKHPVPDKITDDFNTDSLSGLWQWSVFQDINTELRNGKLELYGLPENAGAFLGQKTYDGDYEADVVISMSPSSAEAGIALVGDEKNFVCASVKSNRMRVRKVENEKETILLERDVKRGEILHLRAAVLKGKDIVFSFSSDGKKFTQLNSPAIDGFFLPPWDRAVRVAVISKGKPTEKAVFDSFTLKNK